MGVWHRHDWREVARESVPGALVTGDDVQMAGVVLIREVLDDALYGFTMVELRCETCGDVASRKLTGAFS